MRTSATIRLDVLRRNWLQIARLTGNRRAIVAVVKGNAYGHGARQVAAALADLPHTILGTAYVEEALHLREAGARLPILVLHEPLPAEAEHVVQHRLAVSVYSRQAIHALSRAAERGSTRVDIHIRVDTGFGPPGALPASALTLIRETAEHRTLRLAGVYTHLSSPSDPCSTAEQLSRLDRLVRKLRTDRIDVPLVHAAGSVGLLRYPRARMTAVRPGTALYGRPRGTPGHDTAGLESVMVWRTSIADIRTTPPGSTLGYNSGTPLCGTRRIGRLPVGYADGFSVDSTAARPVLVRGRMAPVIGRPSMDTSFIDLTGLRDADIGDEVVLLGAQEGAEILACEVGALGGVATPEIWCRVSARVPRIYTGYPAEASDDPDLGRYHAQPGTP